MLQLVMFDSEAMEMKLMARRRNSRTGLAKESFYN